MQLRFEYKLIEKNKTLLSTLDLQKKYNYKINFQMPLFPFPAQHLPKFVS